MAGCVNDARFRKSTHFLGKFTPAQAPGPKGFSPGKRKARSCPMPVCDLSLPEPSPDKTVNGRPLCAVAIPLSCQSPKTPCRNPFEPDTRGSCQTYDPTKRCV